MVTTQLPVVDSLLAEVSGHFVRGLRGLDLKTISRWDLPLANNQKEKRDLCPPNTKNWILSIIWRSCEEDPEPQMRMLGRHLDLSLGRPWAEDPVMLHPNFGPTDLWDNKHVLFEAATFGGNLLPIPALSLCRLLILSSRYLFLPWHSQGPSHQLSWGAHHIVPPLPGGGL